MSSFSCNVEPDENPLVSIDIHHPALIVRILEIQQVHLPFEANLNQKSYNYKKANYPALYEAIGETNWSFLSDYDDVDIVVGRFYDKLYSILDTHVPLYRNYKRKFPCWFNSERIKNIKQKNISRRNYLRTGDRYHEAEFKRLRSLIKLQIKTAYNQYMHRVGNSLQSDPAIFWSYVNQKTNHLGFLGKCYISNMFLRSHS
nr:unnamed protein product [Callosobruchus analis]